MTDNTKRTIRAALEVLSTSKVTTEQLSALGFNECYMIPVSEAKERAIEKLTEIIGERR